tara:strand:- start:1294 stop:1521 length:228 start_codon:yes stop_codon:yes gene_type:complete
MQKTYFHNNKPQSENKYKNKTPLINRVKIKKVVDVNILLNRVKIEKKNEMKRKIIFVSSVLLAVGLLGTFIIIIK